MKIINKLLGVILSATDKQKQLIIQVQKEWLETQFQKDLYDAIYNIALDNEIADILNITQWMRNNKRLKNDYIVKIAGVQSEVNITELMNIKGLFNEVYYRYAIRQISLMVQNVHQELILSNPSSDKILKEIERGYNAITNTNASEIKDNREIVDQLIEKHDNAKLGISIGLDLGYDNLKNYIVLEPDDVMIVGGRPAMGKTAWSISALKNLIIDQNKKVIYFSLEMSKDRIIRRLISLITGINTNIIKSGQCDVVQMDRIYNLKKENFWNNLFIIDGSQSIRDIQSHVIKLCASMQIDCIIIDYLQKIIPEKNSSRYDEVTRLSNSVKRLVMSQRIPCIALAQLSRDSARSGKRPTLPDLKESGEIEQDASIVAFLHRPEYYGVTIDDEGNNMEGIGEFIIAKNRDGQTGIVEMKVNLGISSWADYDRSLDVFDNYNDEF